MTPGQAQGWIGMVVDVQVTAWLAVRCNGERVRRGKLQLVTNKALGMEVPGRGLVWTPLSQVERIDRAAHAQQAKPPPRREPLPPAAPRLQDPYAVLGVAPGADWAAVKAAYRERMRLLHPDLNPASRDPELGKVLNERAAAINAAFTMLERAFAERVR
jgi:hypothetical protein